MPRDGDVKDIKWFQGPKGVYCYHMMNAWEDAEGLLHFDQCLSSSNAFAFIREPAGLFLQPWEITGGLTRWTVDPRGPAGPVTETVIGPPGDFPIIPAKSQGRPYKTGWMLTMNPDRRGPPVMGGPVLGMFDMLVRLDGMDTASPQITQALPMEPGWCYNEPVHVPSATPGHDGWLVTMVDHQIGEDAFEHFAWVVDAGNLGAGPVATVQIPTRLRPQVHGWWVPQAQLDAVRTGGAA